MYSQEQVHEENLAITKLFSFEILLHLYFLNNVSDVTWVTLPGFRRRDMHYTSLGDD